MEMVLKMVRIVKDNIINDEFFTKAEKKMV
jgi:hypothetical protein